MKIAIGSDHAGFELKAALAEYITELGHELTDHGTYSLDSVDYPDFAHKVASDVNDNSNVIGVLVCGSGQGVCMTANKYSKVRAALVWNLDMAELSREHNNANIICLPARFVTPDEAKTFVKAFIKTEFEGGRHERRVNKITEGTC